MAGKGRPAHTTGEPGEAHEGELWCKGVFTAGRKTESNGSTQVWYKMILKEISPAYITKRHWTYNCSRGITTFDLYCSNGLQMIICIILFNALSVSQSCSREVALCGWCISPTAGICPGYASSWAASSGQRKAETDRAGQSEGKM